MWPLCHNSWAGRWSGWNVVGDVLGVLLGTLIPLLLLAALVGLGIVLFRRLRGPGAKLSFAPHTATASGHEIAQARYARGEISREQYHELIQALSGGKDGEQ